MSGSTRPNTILLTITTALSVLVGLYAIAFLAISTLWQEFLGQHGPDYSLAPALILHVAFAAPALITGPFQFFSAIRMKRPQIHRALGYIYIISAAVSAACGLIAAQQALLGLTPQIGFSALALAWGYTTWRAFAAARSRQFSDHEIWMKRSFALTFAAVTLRIQLGSAMAAELPFESIYPTIAWACWVPNLIIAEWFWVQPRQRASVLSAQPKSTA